MEKVPKILNRILDYFIFCWHLYARRKSHWFLIVQYFNLPLLLLPSIILRVSRVKLFDLPFLFLPIILSLVRCLLCRVVR